ncbi:MAG: NAD(P)H-dependent glycerol-3-phosphate dehydrogenase [bacterium]
MSERICILGAGSWGLTLACLLAKKQHKVKLWESDAKQAEILERTRQFKFLPGLVMPDDLHFSSEIKSALEGAQVIVYAVPSQVVGSVSEKISPYLKKKGTVIVIATKGVDALSSLRMSEIVCSGKNSDLIEKTCVLSGPTIAIEVMRKIPTAAVVAAKNKNVAERVQQLLMTPYFRLYTSDDVAGVEIGGSIKNIIAIAAGIGDGLGLGTNAKAALMTRGVVEIVRLGARMGANPDTFHGLSGIGDLITTCISKHSRNRSFGEKIGQGMSTQDALDEIQMVVEGVETTKGVMGLAKKMDIDMPITAEVYGVLFEGKSPRKVVGDLMNRQAKPEVET